MVRAAIRGIWEHKLRTLLLVLSIVAGVSFVAGSLIFTDTIGGSFDALFEGAFEGIDIRINPDVDQGFTNLQPAFDADVLTIVESTPGIIDTWPGVGGLVNLSVGGEVQSVQGPPNFALSWEGDPTLTLVEGRGPQGPTEVAIDTTARERYDLAIGDTIGLAATGAISDYTVTGVLEGFGAGPALFTFDLATATSVLGLNGLYTTIDVTVEDPALLQEVLDDLTSRLPDGVVAVDAQAAAEEQAAQLKQALGFIQTVLLVFAGISVVVGVFVVYNAFRTVLGQRTRELALFRVLGATKQQLVTSVIVEALVIGLISGVAGLIGGILLATAARAAFSLFGGSGLADGGLVLAPGTFVTAFAVGMTVTLVSALLPAARASQVSPMAALATIDKPPRRLTKQLVVGSVLGVPGIVLVALTGLDRVNLLTGGIGALAILIATYVFGAIVGRPFVRTIARFLGNTPVRKIATDNAARSPRRTGATAGALMFGVAFVVAVSVIVVITQKTATAVLEDAVSAELTIQSAGADPTAGVSPEIASIVGQLDFVAATQSSRFAQGSINGESTFFGSFEPETVEQAYFFDEVQGNWSDLVGETVAVQRAQADELGLAPGDPVTVDLGTGPEQWTVAVVWDYSSSVDDTQGFYLPTSTLADRFPQGNVVSIGVKLTDGTDPDQAKATIAELIQTDYPFANVTTQDELLADIQGQLLGLLAFVFVLLAMSIFIALLGIVLILLLSVFERTRELGLLRAIGSTRVQIRAMIRWEAVFVSILGALMGVVVGTFIGWGLSGSIFGAGFSFVIPWTWIGLGLIASIVAGVLAAILPARRAANLNILEAIAYE
ncbi:MAG: ABC transporter permease [Acidimicrobiia bacterium]|nr:ABC transporter permease [Acidimicrobiia bacterium]